jgi:hypothetical protein
MKTSYQQQLSCRAQYQGPRPVAGDPRTSAPEGPHSALQLHATHGRVVRPRPTHRLEWVFAPVRLSTQHDPIHPIQHRVGNVSRLGPAQQQGRPSAT